MRRCDGGSAGKPLVALSYRANPGPSAPKKSLTKSTGRSTLFRIQPVYYSVHHPFVITLVA